MQISLRNNMLRQTNEVTNDYLLRPYSDILLCLNSDRSVISRDYGEWDSDDGWENDE